MIDEIASKFVEVVNVTPHLLPLYKQKEIKVLLKCEGQQIGMVADHQQLKIEKLQIDNPKVTITGSKADLKQLLFGEEKLFEMKKRNDLYVEGRYRDLLQMEAIFLLAKFKMNQFTFLHNLA